MEAHPTDAGLSAAGAVTASPCASFRAPFRQTNALRQKDDRGEQKHVEQKPLPLRRNDKNARILHDTEHDRSERRAPDIAYAADDCRQGRKQHQLEARQRLNLGACSIEEHADGDQGAGNQHRQRKYALPVDAIELRERGVVGHSDHESGRAAKTA